MSDMWYKCNVDTFQWGPNYNQNYTKWFFKIGKKLLKYNQGTNKCQFKQSGQELEPKQ